MANDQEAPRLKVRYVYPLSQVNLGQRGLDYLRTELGRASAIGAMLLSRLDLAQGDVVTYVPSGTPEEYIYEFRGSILPEPPEGDHELISQDDGSKGRLVPIPNLHELLTSFLTEFMFADRHRLCLVLDPFARPSDPFPDSPFFTTAAFENDVYRILSSAQVEGVHNVAPFVERATRFNWKGVLTSVPSTLDIPLHRGAISRGLLEALAQRTEKLLIDAYDHEGFLIWSRTPGSNGFEVPEN